MSHGLSEETVAKIQAVLAREEGIEKAVLYGSRAKGTHSPGSDIDLTLMGESLTLGDLERLIVDLDDLLLPFFIDLSLFHLIQNPALREHIGRAGVVLYERR